MINWRPASEAPLHGLYVIVIDSDHHVQEGQWYSDWQTWVCPAWYRIPNVVAWCDKADIAATYRPEDES